MKAVRIHEYGGPEVLRSRTRRGPRAAGKVLVHVHAARINPIDWKIRAGHVRDWLKYKLPMIPGWDLSGTIERLVQTRVTGRKAMRCMRARHRT
jgi:NADPH:quinone reductase-like Zn-dependent oxidoreductase